MLRVRRRCVQTAHISLHSFKFSKSTDTKQTATPELRAYLPSHIQNFLTGISTRLPSTASASLRLLVFGEAVFRETPICPQEEKTHTPSFFCRTQRLQGFSTSAAYALGKALTAFRPARGQICANPSNLVRICPSDSPIHPANPAP